MSAGPATGRRDRLAAPIFFVGMPRSGTTVLFQAFAARGDLGWPSQYLDRAPRFPVLALASRLADVAPALRRSVGRSDLSRPWVEKFKAGPSEAYAFWRHCCGEKFLYDYLIGVEASPAERSCVRSTVARILRYQGKQHFAAKITGPARIGYLTSIFPDARFVHVIRDGRAVVNSLLNVPFWREGGRMREPAWRNGLLPEDIEDWERHDRSPLALAAVQWRRVVSAARTEAAEVASDRYAEVSYERFVGAPADVLAELSRSCGLAPDPRGAEHLRARVELRDMNFQWRERFTDAELRSLNELQGALLTELGYGVDPPAPPSAGPAVVRPLAGIA